MAQILTNNTTLHHGKYRIIRELGQGGFGVTYLAMDTEHKTQVAIKEYFPKIWCHRESGSTSITITHDEYQDLVMKGKQRFLKEAKNLNKLNSPDKNDIVKVYSAFEENHTVYYVMEYIPGVTLAKKVKDVGKLNVRDAVLIMDQLCDAVSYIHSKRMTHYDLKPQNIIIRESNGRPVIIDFGLSKQYDSKGEATSSMMFAHSDGYSPIELYGSTLNDNVFSPQTDVYSLGAIMYFMLRGIRPPEASTLINHPLPSDNIAPDVYEVICKAMGYSKASRYPTVIEFKNDLDKAAKGINPFPTGEDTVIGNTTTYGSSTSNNGSNESGPAEEKDSIFKKYWWIIGLAAVVALAIIFSRKDYEHTPDSGPEVEIVPEVLNDLQEVKETEEVVEAKIPGINGTKYTAAFFESDKNKASKATADKYAQTASGLKYVIAKEGNGKSPSATDVVTVHYVGTLTDGSVFDSSVDRGEPIDFPLNAVIPGWTEGLQLMKEGGEAVFFIPSNLAYGPREIPGIPANSTLMFWVQLIKVN